MENVTLVIITFNRYNFLKRLIKYLYTYPFNYNIIILDSSEIYSNDPELIDLIAEKIYVGEVP